MAGRNGNADMQWGINTFNQGMQRRRQEQIAADEQDAAAGEQAQQQGVGIFEQARKAAADREALQEHLAAQQQSRGQEQAWKAGEHALTRAEEIAKEEARAKREEALAKERETGENTRASAREEGANKRNKATIEGRIKETGIRGTNGTSAAERHQNWLEEEKIRQDNKVANQGLKSDDSQINMYLHGAAQMARFRQAQANNVLAPQDAEAMKEMEGVMNVLEGRLKKRGIDPGKVLKSHQPAPGSPPPGATRGPAAGQGGGGVPLIDDPE